MNYLGAEPARYQLRTNNFWYNIEFILECPSASRRRAMGDDLLSFEPLKIVYLLESKPTGSSPSSLRSFPPSPEGIPCGKRGTFIFSDPEGRGIKPLMIKCRIHSG